MGSSMSLFDLIPTVGEIIDSASCIITDHDWVKVKVGEKVVIVCETCGKRK